MPQCWLQKHREKKKRSTAVCQMSNAEERIQTGVSSAAQMRKKVTTFPKHTSMPSLSECEDFSMEGYM